MDGYGWRTKVEEGKDDWEVQRRRKRRKKRKRTMGWKLTSGGAGYDREAGRRVRKK